MATIPCCPITGVSVVNPVQCPNGHCFEESAIITWLATNTTCPIGRELLTLPMLVPNRALKEMIEAASAPVVTIPVAATASTTTPLITVAPVISTSAQLWSSTITGDIPMSGSFTRGKPESWYTCTINVPDSMERYPLDVALVIDVSGSMGSEVHAEGAEGTGLTVLNVVDHAARTCINMLGDQDRLCMITYSDDARGVLGLTQMDADGKTRAELASTGMSAGGTTNIWAGLKAAIDTLKTYERPNRNQVVLLLTDGQPTYPPSIGHKGAFETYALSQKFNGVLYTFGFGYVLDEKEGQGLLIETALAGSGSFAFIPDGSMIGRTFPTVMAEALTTVGTHVKLELDLPKQLVETKNMKYPCVSSDKVVLSLGTLRNGQSLDVAIKLKTPPTSPVNGVVRYSSPLSGACTVEVPTVQAEAVRGPAPQSVLRMQFVNVVFSACMSAKMSDFPGAQKCIREFAQSDAADDLPETTKADLVGQIAIAFSEAKHYQKWGKYYLPNLLYAHLFQICLNSMDPGIQVYGGSLSKALRLQGNNIFAKLPAPVPPVKATPYYGGGSGYSSGGRPSTAYHAPIDMGAINQGPCFLGGCVVAMKDGPKLVRDVKPGDITESGAKVVLVIETPNIDGKERFLVTLGNLVITEWHPVQLVAVSASTAAPWQFPIDITASSAQDWDCIYSFVLDSQHYMRIGAYNVATLNHKSSEPVLQHDYFGTEAVIADLSRAPGFKDGHVVVRPENWVNSRFVF